jgi:type 1 glutamine amidotransferase
VLAVISVACAIYVAGNRQALARNRKGRLLYLTQSAGYKHASIPLSREIVKQIGDRSGGWETDYADTVAPFTAENLRNYTAVMFFTSGELPFTEVQKRTLAAYVRAGTGFIGVHSATDTLHGWDTYHQIIGGYYEGHPWHQQVTVDVADPKDKIVEFLGHSFEISDEIYQIGDFRDDGDVNVLLRLDPMSVDRSKPGVRFVYYQWPLAWTRKYGKGRVFYTALGHEDAVWRDERFQRLLQNGIEWTMHEFSDKSGSAPGP